MLKYLSFKAPYHGNYWIRNVMVHAGGVTYEGEITLSNIRDMVESIYPEDNQEIN